MGLSALLYIPKKMRLSIFSSRSSACCHSLCRISVTKFSYVASSCAVSRLPLFPLCWGIPMNISFPGNSLKKARFGSGIWGSQVGMGLCPKDLMVASLCMHLFLFTAKDWQFWGKNVVKVTLSVMAHGLYKLKFCVQRLRKTWKQSGAEPVWNLPLMLNELQIQKLMQPVHQRLFLGL